MCMRWYVHVPLDGHPWSCLFVPLANLLICVLCVCACIVAMKVMALVTLSAFSFSWLMSTDQVSHSLAFFCISPCDSVSSFNLRYKFSTCLPDFVFSLQSCVSSFLPKCFTRNCFSSQVILPPPPPPSSLLPFPPFSPSPPLPIQSCLFCSVCMCWGSSSRWRLLSYAVHAMAFFTWLCCVLCTSSGYCKVVRSHSSPWH